MIFLDLETVGLTGAPVLLQWAEDGGPVHLVDPLSSGTPELIEWFCTQTVCVYNLAFDWFHIQRLYCVLTGHATWDRPGGPCVKPAGAMDLYLHMVKGPLQDLRSCRNDDGKERTWRVRKVPTPAAEPLVSNLKSCAWPVALTPNIRSKDRGDGWSDILISFKTGLGLKPVCELLLGKTVIDMPIPKECFPPKHTHDFNSLDWLPMAQWHRDYWRENEEARRYAKQDIDLLRDLYEWAGRPEPDYDSELAVATACTRYKGFEIDVEGFDREIETLAQVEGAVKHDHHSVKAALKKVVPSVIEVKATNDEALKVYEGFAPEYVAQVRAARKAKKSLDILRKIRCMGRFHPEFNVVGTLTGRMSAPIAMLIPKGPIRKLIHITAGGDFDGFEVAIAAALYDDPALTEELLAGRKFHALFGASVYGMTYDEILEDKDKYARAKAAVFATMYGAQGPKIAQTLGLDLADAEVGRMRLLERFPGIARAQKFVEENYSTMSQGDDGIVRWKDPRETVESLLGYERSFRVDVHLAKTLKIAADELAGIPKGECLRRKDKGPQTLNGACRSALYGAAFQTLNSIQRVAGNHQIQATGGEITKRLQARLWALQPAGVHEWRIAVMNVHDELLADARVDTKPTVDEFVEEYREKIPMLSIGWKTGIKNWSER